MENPIGTKINEKYAEWLIAKLQIPITIQK
jgi:hypothetical protein